MKQIWLTPRDLVGKYNLPNTVQGLTKKARNEDWVKRKVKGQKGGGYEYEVSSVIDRYNLLSRYEAGDDGKIKIPAQDFLSDYVMIPELVVLLSQGLEPTIITHDIGEIILSKKFLEKEGLLNTRLAATYMDDDSMEPTISEGDTVLIGLKDYSPSFAFNGIFVFLLKDKQLINRLQYDPINATYMIKSDNPSYPDFIVNPKEEPTFKVIAKVERIISKK